MVNNSLRLSELRFFFFLIIKRDVTMDDHYSCMVLMTKRTHVQKFQGKHQELESQREKRSTLGGLLVEVPRTGR